MLLIIAEGASAVAGLDASSIMPSIASVTSLGFAIWFAYYTTTVTLPNQQKEHREERDKTQTLFTASLKDVLDEMRTQREFYDRWKGASK